MSRIEQAIQMLRSQDPEIRRKAIQYLARSGAEDSKALRALGWSYKNDPDPALRDLARKGGIYLKRQMDDGGSVAPGAMAGGASLMQSYERARERQGTQHVDDAFTFDEEDYDADHEGGYGDDDADEDDDFGTAFAFDDDEDDNYGAYDDDDDFGTYDEDDTADKDGPLDWDAKRQIDRAMDLHLDGDDAGALKALAKALDIDPRTRHENEALNVASAATGLNGEDALRMLATPSKRAEMLGNVAESGGKAKRDDGPSAGTLFMDIGIFALINAVGMIVTFVLAANRFLPTLRQFQASPEYADFLAQSGGVDVLEPLLGALTQAIAIVVAMSIGIAIVTVLMVFLQNFVLHFIATSMFGGEGTATATIDRLFNLNSIYYVVSYALLVGVMFMMPTDYEAFADGSATAWTLYSNCLNPIIGLVYLVAMGVVLGQVQRIGAVKGCAAYFVFTVGLIALSCCGGFILGTIGSAASVGIQ